MSKNFLKSGKKSHPLFSLIICGYNESKNIERAVNSCLSLDYPKNKYEIIYVDNNSKDNSLDILSSLPIKFYVEKEKGLSEARNCGISHSKGEILVFLDVDIELSPQYLINLEKSYKDSMVGASGGKVVPLITTIISNYLGVSLFEGYPRYKNYRLVTTYPGCNLSIRRKVLEEVGAFKTGLSSDSSVTRFAEDKEMCLRIRRHRYKVLYNPDAVIKHKNRYLLRDLIKVWYKGSKTRLAGIREGNKDPLTAIFRYNIPILYILISLFLLFTLPFIGLFLLVAGAISLFILGLKSYFETGLFFTSLIIKPVLDGLSLLIINLSILYWRFVAKI